MEHPVIYLVRFSVMFQSWVLIQYQGKTAFFQLLDIFNGTQAFALPTGITEQLRVQLRVWAGL